MQTKKQETKSLRRLKEVEEKLQKGEYGSADMKGFVARKAGIHPTSDVIEYISKSKIFEWQKLGTLMNGEPIYSPVILIKSRSFFNNKVY